MADIKYETGFGVSQADMKRGYIKPSLPVEPEYDAANYREKWTRQPNTGFGSPVYDFRYKEEETKGFLTRPILPTER